MNEDYRRLLKIQTITTYHQLAQETCQKREGLEQQIEEIDKRIKRLRDRHAIAEELAKQGNKVSNLEKCVFASKLAATWDSGGYADKIFLQYRNFPKWIQKLEKRLGEKLRKLRDEKDLSLREFAALADTDYSQIHRIEIWQISPTAIILENLAEALKVTPCVFFDCEMQM